MSNCSGNCLPAAAVPEAIPGVVVAEIEGSGLGELPGLEAVFLGWVAVAGRHWRAECTAAQRPCTGDGVAEVDLECRGYGGVAR